MTVTTPIEMFWADGGLRPVNDFWARRARKVFVEGEIYNIADQGERSDKTHRHYFALVREAWMNMPEHLDEKFPTSEHMRKYALVKAGYCDSDTLVCASVRDAERMAAFMRPVDEYGVIEVRDNIITRYVAKSQSRRAMTKAEFQASKEAVLSEIAKIIGTDIASLKASEAA